ncbi:MULTISPECIES: hypothetical protein [unclassified Microcoleus]|uniref:hypothetical protein n=1 Tax=unclassified Microcoleus TaxID=2642155 RepID=UPI002FD129DC
MTHELPRFATKKEVRQRIRSTDLTDGRRKFGNEQCTGFNGWKEAGKIIRPIPNYPLPITNSQLPITHYQFPITHFQRTVRV